MHEAMSMNLHIEDYQDSFPIAFYKSTRMIYRAVKPIVKSTWNVILILVAIPLVIIAIALSPILIAIPYLLFLKSNKQIERSGLAMKTKWKEEPRSERMFDTLDKLITIRSVLERDGKFKMPKKFKMFWPFFVQMRRFYNNLSEQIVWLENKLYPTAEELGIPLEDVEFMRSQMTAKDYEDLKDPDWFEFEKECIVKN